MPAHQDLIVLGAGKLYVDPFDSNGLYTGEDYFGDTPGFSTNIAMQNVEVWGNDSAVAELLANIGTRVTRNANVVCQHASVANMARFFVAESSTASQSSGSVSDEAISSVKQGRWYQLGRNTSFPGGARSISAVTVTDDAGSPTTYDITDDYELDLTLGRIYIVPGGAIVDGTNLEVDYTKAAVAWDRISTGNVLSVRGALRYIADNTRGPNRDLYAPQVELRPNGDLQFKSRDQLQQITWQVSFEKPASGSALYIEGRPVA
jgi:hypothetical protein